MTNRLALVVLCAALAGACQTVTAPTPAVLAKGDADSMARLKAALARAMGQAQVELGPGDPTQTSVLSVLPRPLSPQEDRSRALPTIFRLEIEGRSCFVVRQDTGARQPLEGIDCRPAG